jgi:hypothetical protein
MLSVLKYEEEPLPHRNIQSANFVVRRSRGIPENRRTLGYARRRTMDNSYLNNTGVRRTFSPQG